MFSIQSISKRADILLSMCLSPLFCFSFFSLKLERKERSTLTPTPETNKQQNQPNMLNPIPHAAVFALG